MNIFVLDENPEAAARMLCDKHVVKMCLETAQILSTINGGPYKPTHANHPCTLWAKGAVQNYIWLVRHGIGIAKEYTHRFNKEHKSEDIICALMSPVVDFPQVEKTPFALAMPDEFKEECPVQSYRNYYRFKRTVVDMKWTGRQVPEWLDVLDEE